MGVEIRSLLVTDVFTVARMLSKVTKGAREDLAKAIKSEEKPDPTELGIAIFQSLFVEVEEDLKAWLADLINKPKEEFETMPATTVIDIIEALVQQEGIADFFERASQLVSKTGSQG